MPPTTRPELDPLHAAFQEALAGRYSLERELGRGGMGIVFLAHEVRLERPVAIKLLPPDIAMHAAMRERFLREARTAARLSHPNIVPIHAVDEAGGFVYFAMAYVPGETAARRVESRGPLPAAEATRILREVAWALAYAHAQGVVHRDIKPENVLLERGSGRAMVADFGIAAMDGASRDTTPGQILGTPEFMSPEQAGGDAVDGRSDLYSLGALGWFLLSGRPPFQGTSTARLLAQHLTAPVPSLAAAVPGLPDAMVKVIERCLAKEPGQRPASGEQLAEELGVVLQTDPEPPAGLRAFLRQARIVPIVVAAPAGVIPFILHFEPEMPLAFRIVALSVIGLSVTAAMAGYAIPQLLQRLFESGYSPTDVAQTADAMARRRREEDLFIVRQDPARKPRNVRLILGALLATFVLDAGALFLRQPWPWSDFLMLAGLGAVTVLQLKSLQDTFSRPKSGATLSGRFWRSRFMAWWWKRHTGAAPEPEIVASNRPTEVRLGQSVDELFAALPLETKRALKDVLPLVRRLEARSQAIRQRLGGPDGGAAAAQLEQLVAALETIRLDLVRLRSGSSSVERITADLAAAAGVEAQIERLLAGRAEVERLLKPATPA